MKKLTFEELEKMPNDFISFYIRVIAKLYIIDIEYEGMKLKYPDYFN